VGRKQNSPVLTANAWHHRSDALSSVVALIGIFGSRFGRLRLLDPLAGMAVAGMVGWMGLRIGVEALMQLTDTSDLSVVDAVHGAAANVEGVLGVDQVRIPEGGKELRNIGRGMPSG
jgi:divalent metal cation (Fe/Co/Zn/Cd) transporter